MSTAPAGPIQDGSGPRARSASLSVGTLVMSAVGAAVALAAAIGVLGLVGSSGTAQQARTRSLIVGVLVIGGVLVLALGWAAQRSIRHGIAQLRRVTDALERGDLSVTANLAGTNELALTAAALDRSVLDRRDSVATLGASVAALAEAAGTLSSSSEHIAAAAEETATQIGMVSAAAEQVSRSVQGVAAGSEQMSVSINEIARSSADAAKVASQAVSSAERASSTVTRLGDSSREIGKVVKLITSIAEQTNLLALNATIEAARAGEAGKGFAVVAGEVKDLAQETARATHDISAKVDAIQTDTEDAVTAISEIGEIIASINTYQLTIASAVEEQTATTAEVSRAVAEAATGTGEIAQNILAVAEAADQTTRGANESRDVTVQLARKTEDLNRILNKFAQ